MGVGFNLPSGDSRCGDCHSGLLNVVYLDGYVKPISSKYLLKLVPAGKYSPFTNFTMDAEECADKTNYPK